MLFFTGGGRSGFVVNDPYAPVRMAVNTVNTEFHGEAAQCPVLYLTLKGNAGPSFLKGLQVLNGVNGKPLFHGAFLQQQGA